MSKIIVTGSYLPKNVVHNNDLIEQTGIDSSDDWITQRTGISQRHFASADETVSTLAVEAARNVLDQMDADIVQEIQLVIVASMSSRLPTPSVASQVQNALGLEKAWAFDVSGACSGFIMALELAEKLSKDKQTGYTLVIGAEQMSDILNFEDRGTSILFGDGAGAVLIEHDGTGLANYRSEITSIPDPDLSICVASETDNDAFMTMDGRGVFNFVLRNVLPSLTKFVAAEAEPLDYVISHQANYRFIEIIAKKLKVSLDKLPTNIASVANTSAASIPILLDDLVKESKVKLDGSQNVIFLGYGAGLAWGQISLKI